MRHRPPPPDDGLPAPRPVPYPATLYDRAAARLARTAARRKLAELQAAGLTVRVAGGALRVGPKELVINGTAQDIERWRDRLIDVLREAVS